MRPAARLGAALAALALISPIAAADSLDPPVDAPESSDVTLARRDSVAAESVELELGLMGGAHGAARRARSLRFSGGDLEGSVREGDNDPLDGAELDGRGALGAWRLGRRAPQWGRGWLVGSPRAPWSDAGAEAGARVESGPRGDLAWAEIGGANRLEGLAGRFAKQDVAAVRAVTGPGGLSVVSTRSGVAGEGLSFESDSLVGEVALDRARRWRADLDVATPRPFGRMGLAARVGSSAFRSLMSPARSGPSQALGATWDVEGARLRPRARAAAWRWPSGETGARGMLEVALRLAQHASLALGAEEQHGVRREGSAPRGMRQGWWGEWRGGSNRVRLELRLEAWGRRSLARDPVRSVNRAVFELRAPWGGGLRVEHGVFRSGSGESLRLSEFDSDRVVLRALSGAGERTRIEFDWPGPAGRVRAGWSCTATAKSPPRTQWTLRWARRARLKGAPS